MHVGGQLVILGGLMAVHMITHSHRLENLFAEANTASFHNAPPSSVAHKLSWLCVGCILGRPGQANDTGKIFMQARVICKVHQVQ